MIGIFGMGLLGLRGIGIMAIAAAVLAAGAWWHGYSSARDRWQAQLAAERSRWQEAALIETQAARQREHEMTQMIDDARRLVTAAKETIDAKDKRIAHLLGRVRVLNTGNDRLRDQLAAYAAGSSADTEAACRDRAGALAAYAADATAFAGGAIERLGAFGRQCAEERDRFAAEVIACVTAWPR